MKVAVLGGGTTGFIAAAQLARFFPQYERIHVYDASRPVIAVGEGTIPVFRDWLAEVTGRSDGEIRRRCRATVKQGICFEGWGEERASFDHWFMPRGQARAWHLDGRELIGLLTEVCRRSRGYRSIDAAVGAVRSNGVEVEVELEGAEGFVADLVIDARGYPEPERRAAGAFDWIATNAAKVRSGPPVRGQLLTRSVARPHGWIAVVPLADRTVYGYVHDGELTAADELEADFDTFFAEEGVAGTGTGTGTGGAYRFPSFVQERVFDGALYSLGSRAGFVEPLEATALGMTLLGLMHLSRLILPELAFHRHVGPYDPDFLDAYNRRFADGMTELSLLIAWYYSRGSRFDSPFWRRARQRFEAARRDPRLVERFASFDGWRQRARAFPDPHQDFEAFRRSWESEGKGAKLGQLFRAHNLAWIGWGIGDFGVPAGDQHELG